MKLKNTNKGITLVALVITIIILLILAGITISALSGENGLIAKVNQAKKAQIKAEMKETLILAINELQLEKEGKATLDDIKQEWADNALENYNPQITSDASINGKKVTMIKNNVTGKYIIDDKLNVIEVENDSSIEFSYEVSERIDNKAKILIRVQDKENGLSRIELPDEDAIIVEENKKEEKGIDYEVEIGKEYKIKVISENGQAKECTVSVELYASDGSWDGKVNSPVLMEGMTGIYWNESGREVIVTTKNKDNWYNYENNKWANAKTEDGSYWVWIPRYAYQITSGCYTNTEGEIKIKFLQGKENKDASGATIKTTYPEVENGAMKDYVVHPAFTNGTANNFKNGEWDDDIKGIWVAKYEMSMEKNGVAKLTGSATVGDVATSSTIKAVSKPGVTSWRFISIGKIYDNSYNYDRTKESHMMKNSEWGAVAYLSHSSYGRNKVEITINGNSSFYTGGRQGATAKTNMAQSSTGNETGIYDLSGGVWEYTAGYITNKNDSLKNGSNFAKNTAANPDGYLSLGTKYVTVYPYDSLKDNNEKNYTRYKSLKSTIYGFGDAILETSSSGARPNTNSWNSDYSSFASSVHPFFARGGHIDTGSGAGAFAFGANAGVANAVFGFRVVLAGK